MFTYAEVDRLSTRMGHALAALGVVSGQTVVTMLDNNIDAVITWLAVNKLGAVSVPINTALRGEFLRHQIADAGTALVICGADYAQRIIHSAQLAYGLPDIKLMLQRGHGKEMISDEMPVALLDAHRGTNAPLFRPSPIHLILPT
ncbi:AMP-binding protein [Glaciimonas sp. PCH181]|uniref:AMP-binding protein n=1 Tax=Glaciimonas sp. PCH181 TaxID=2133943 RepID=UPI00210214E2|nr:AMP-binding protein [Glaciimonas sp. PCH181]